MDGFCRGCLVRYEDPMELIQYTEKNRRLFVYSTGIQVKRTDTFTFQLCKDCYLNMKVACNFKKQCRNSDKRFKSYLGLKDNGENTDLSTFLRNTDDSWMFRFPGNSTPAYQRVKDEDNESTTTSIRNFMMDIMPDDDLPDTEARIIKEVIDEEADVLDDSLDSHWLQDDASIDTDFNLNFSISPFSTPRPVNNDRYTPKKPTSSKVTIKQEKPEEIMLEDDKVIGCLDMPPIDVESDALIPIKLERNLDESMDTVNEFLENENNFMKDENDYLKTDSEHIDHVNTEPASQCTIDRNLEDALKNTENNEFSLDQLLVSPKVIPGIKSPPTPLINNILFGEKLEMDDNSNSSHKLKSAQIIETYETVSAVIELTEDFSMDVKLDELDLEELKTKIIDEIDEQTNIQNNPINITNFYCNMCQKTFKNLRSLKQHYRRHLKDKSSTKFICDFCGKQCNERTNFVRHVQTHTRPPPPKYECSICKLEFMSENNLNQHKRTHMGEKQQVNKKKIPLTHSEKSRIYREKLKNINPKKYEEIKRKNRLRAMKAYLKKKKGWTDERVEEKLKWRHNESSKRQKPLSSSEKSRRYREKLKTLNPEKYEEMKRRCLARALKAYRNKINRLTDVQEKRQRLKKPQKESDEQQKSLTRAEKSRRYIEKHKKLNPEDMKRKNISRARKAYQNNINCLTDVQEEQMLKEPLKQSGEPQRPLTQAEKSKRYREKVKTFNPEKYEEMKRKSKSRSIKAYRNKINCLTDAQEEKQKLTKRQKENGEQQRPLTSAEKSKRYRERLKILNPEKYEEMKRKSKSRSIKAYRNKINRLTEMQEEKQKLTKKQKERGEQQGPLTQAEKSRRYRERLKILNPEKYEEMKRKSKSRSMKAYRKKINCLAYVQKEEQRLI